jgi:UDP-2,3-diacylglucosamine pyrophosphatase LpxH
VRALVISDTHFGAWTGRDLLREEGSLERLAPHLDEIDELIFLGDLFDLLFGSVDDAFGAAEGLFDLIAEKMSGRRLVFLAGNHDHHLVYREREDPLEKFLDDGRPPGGAEPQPASFTAFLQRRLPGVEIEVAYPTYTFEGVLCTHGHHLDPHARLAGSRGSRLLTHMLWSIAAGGPEEPRTLADYESVLTLLTEWLYVAAQEPHGTTAQQNVFRATRRAGVAEAIAALPVHGALRVAATLRRRPARFVAPGDPAEHALEAFAKAVANLGWNEQADQIVFAHTHQPLADLRSSRDSRTRYWNTGSWIYEPDRGRAAFARYCRNAWPGTAVLIDGDEPEPRLVEMLADLNPLNR